MTARALAIWGLAVLIVLVAAIVTAQPAMAAQPTRPSVTVKQQRVCYTLFGVRRCHVAQVRVVHRSHR